MDKCQNGRFIKIQDGGCNRILSWVTPYIHIKKLLAKTAFREKLGSTKAAIGTPKAI